MCILLTLCDNIFCSHYLQSIILLYNTSLQNDPWLGSNDKLQSSLSILNKSQNSSRAYKHYWLHDD